MKKIKILLSGLLLTTMLNATNYGLVIGCCSKYEKLDKVLQGIINDANGFASTLERVCDRDNIELLIDKSATKNIIKQKLLDLESRLKQGDRLYFYFSGHGARAGDKKVFMKKIDGDDDLNKRLNQTALITYDYDKRDSYNTTIITSKDLAPIFKRLDNRGVQIIMFADSCFAGNSFRSIMSDKIKRLQDESLSKLKQPKTTKLQYKNLIFFGASLNSLQAREITDKYGKKRGEFSNFLNYCLDNGDINGDMKITKKELQRCMIDEFPSYATSSSIYPINKLEDRIIFNAKIKNYKLDRSLPKVKYSGKLNLSGVANIVKSGYELEITLNGSMYDIFKIGGLYAKVKKEKLLKYLKGYRLIALKGKDILDVFYKSETTDKVEDTFCAKEIIQIGVNSMTNPHLIVLTLDSNGKIIMLKTKHNQVYTEVTEPFGIDRVKIFTFNNQDIYNKAIKYQNQNSGILSTEDSDMLYELLSQEDSLKGQELTIRTISKSINQCKSEVDR